MSAKGHHSSAINNAHSQYQASKSTTVNLSTSHSTYSKLLLKLEDSNFMGRQNNNPTVLQSSIALLQERFRQLQRVKEMREEREHQRAFTQGQGERLNPNAQCGQPMWFVHPDLVHPSRPLRGPPSCWLDDHSDSTDFQALETSLSTNLCPYQTTARHPVMSNETDVDTTLHL